MPKLHIPVNDISLYELAPNLEDILPKLNFNEAELADDDWNIYTRRNEENEFVGIYKNASGKGYIIFGRYDDLGTTKKDLDTITQSLFNEKPLMKDLRLNGNVYGKIFRKSAEFLLIANLGLNFLVYKRPSSFDNAFMAPIALAVTGLALNTIPKIFYGIKLQGLSNQSEQYLLGKAAESRLAVEYKYDKSDDDWRKEFFVKQLEWDIRYSGLRIPLKDFDDTQLL